MLIKKLGKALTTTSLATLYTAPGVLNTNKTMIKEIVMCNTDTAVTAMVTLHAVNSGGSAGALSTLIATNPLMPGETQTWSFSTVLEAGDFIQVLGTTATVAVHISGVEL